MEPLADYIPCPFCAEMIHPSAIKCKHCKTFIKGGASSGSEELTQIKKELTAAAERPANLEGQPGKFRIATWILLALTIGAIGLCFLPVSRSDREGVIVLGVVLGIVLGIIWLVLFVTDVMTPSSRGRSTPQQAALAYLRALRYRRWKSAFACLSPMARRQTQAEIPIIPEMGCKGGIADLETPSGVKDYWSSILTPSLGTVRRVTQVATEPLDGGTDTMRRVRVSLFIEYYPQWHSRQDNSYMKMRNRAPGASGIRNSRELGFATLALPGFGASTKVRTRGVARTSRMAPGGYLLGLAQL